MQRHRRRAYLRRRGRQPMVARPGAGRDVRRLFLPWSRGVDARSGLFSAVPPARCFVLARCVSCCCNYPSGLGRLPARLRRPARAPIPPRSRVVRCKKCAPSKRLTQDGLPVDHGPTRDGFEETCVLFRSPDGHTVGSIQAPFSAQQGFHTISDWRTSLWALSLAGSDGARGRSQWR